MATNLELATESVMAKEMTIIEKPIQFEIYALSDAAGRWFKLPRYMNLSSWTEYLEEAKLYRSIGPARARRTLLKKSGIFSCIAMLVFEKYIILDDSAYLSKEEQRKKRHEKSLLSQEIEEAKQDLEEAKKEVERLSKLVGVT